jgi:RNA polymerase sigma factor (sigma-70 family)
MEIGTVQQITQSWTRLHTQGLRARGFELDDLHQEALIAAWQKPKHPHMTAKSRFIKFANGRRHYTGNERKANAPQVRSITLSDDDWTDLAERHTTMEESEARIDVQAAVKVLPEKYRRIVWHRFYEGLQWDEVGAKVGLSGRGVLSVWERHIQPALAEALR